MGTRSTITVMMGNKEIHAVYCHWDGHESHNGKLLLEHYNSQELAEKIVALGSLSSLDESVEYKEGHSFETPIEGLSVAYHRDREEDLNIYHLDNLSDLYTEEYNYLWSGSKWTVSEGDENNYRDIVIEE